MKSKVSSGNSIQGINPYSSKNADCTLFKKYPSKIKQNQIWALGLPLINQGNNNAMGKITKIQITTFGDLWVGGNQSVPAINVKTNKTMPMPLIKAAVLAKVGYDILEVISDSFIVVF
jgi:hypothetical protein